MKPTQQLHDLGQSLWLDNITRGLLTNGALRRYIGDLSYHTIKESNFYDDAIHEKIKQGMNCVQGVQT